MTTQKRAISNNSRCCWDEKGVFTQRLQQKYFTANFGFIAKFEIAVFLGVLDLAGGLTISTIFYHLILVPGFADVVFCWCASYTPATLQNDFLETIEFIETIDVFFRRRGTREGRDNNSCRHSQYVS